MFQLSKATDSKVQGYLAKDLHKLIVASWLVLMIALVVLKFGDALFA
jgi:hypothetical protein